MAFRSYLTGVFGVTQKQGDASFVEDVPAQGLGWRYSLKQGRRTDWYSLPVYHGEKITSRELQMIALIILAQVFIAGLIFAVGQTFVPVRLAMKISLVCLLIGAISMVVGFLVYNHREHRIHYSGWTTRQKNKVLQFFVSPVNKKGHRATRSPNNMFYGRSAYELRNSNQDEESHAHKHEKLKELANMATHGC